MRHWAPSSEDAEAVRLPASDRQRLAELLGTATRAAPQTARRTRADFGSLVGLTLALTFLAGLAWAIAPVEPVAAEVR